jgi:hypothetical protein
MARGCSSTGYRVVGTVRQGVFLRIPDNKRFESESHVLRTALRTGDDAEPAQDLRGKRSATDGRPEISERELRGGLAAALGTMLNVPPATKQPGAFRIQQHHEGLGQWVDLHPVARLPLGGGGGVMIRTLDQPTEPRMVHVDNPGAVARLDDDLFHTVSIP